mgnify:CR=1 FL=1
MSSKRTTVNELPTSAPMRPRAKGGRGCRYVTRPTYAERNAR